MLSSLKETFFCRCFRAIGCQLRRFRAWLEQDADWDDILTVYETPGWYFPGMLKYGETTTMTDLDQFQMDTGAPDRGIEGIKKTIFIPPRLYHLFEGKTVRPVPEMPDRSLYVTDAKGKVHVFEYKGEMFPDDVSTASVNILGKDGG